MCRMSLLFFFGALFSAPLSPISLQFQKMAEKNKVHVNNDCLTDPVNMLGVCVAATVGSEHHSNNS